MKIKELTHEIREKSLRKIDKKSPRELSAAGSEKTCFTPGKETPFLLFYQLRDVPMHFLSLVGAPCAVISLIRPLKRFLLMN